MYFSRSDFAKLLNCSRICLCRSGVGVSGVGEKVSPLSSSRMSSGDSSNVLKL